MDQDVLVSGRIEVAQEDQLHPGGGGRAREGPRRLDMLGLQGHDPPGGAHCRHDRAQSAHDLPGVGTHQVLIRVQQRLALAAIGDDRPRPRLELDVGGKSGSALAHHSGPADRIEQDLGVRVAAQGRHAP
jgi:hypothetical protein